MQVVILSGQAIGSKGTIVVYANKKGRDETRPFLLIEKVIIWRVP